MDDKTALERILDLFYESNGSLEWSYQEGTTIADVDNELSEYLINR